MAELNSTGTGTRAWHAGDELLAVAEGGASPDSLARLTGLPIGFIQGLDAALDAKRNTVDSIPWTAISGKPTFFSGSWNDLDDRPASFPPSAHGHPAAEISDFDAAVAASPALAATAKLAVAQDFTAAQSVTPVVLTDAATISWDADASNNFKVTVTANRTLGANTAGTLTDGAVYTFRVIQDGTGGWALAYASLFDLGGATITIATDPGAVTILTGQYVSETGKIHLIKSWPA